MMAHYDLLRRFGSEEKLRDAIAVTPDLKIYAQEELASLPDSILDRCYISRQYVTILRRALGLTTQTFEEVEAAHEERMKAAIKQAAEK